MGFGKNVVTWRQKKGVSQIKLAESIGLKQPSLSAIESEKTSPSFQTMIAISEALECSIADLFGGSSTSIPVIGKVSAGVVPADEQFYDVNLSISELFKLDSSTVKMLEVEGSSMVDEHILHGDYIAIRMQPEAMNGEIVVAWIGGDFPGLVFKVLKVAPQTGKRTLLSRDGSSSPIPVDEETKIIGVYVGLVRKAK